MLGLRHLFRSANHYPNELSSKCRYFSALKTLNSRTEYTTSPNLKPPDLGHKYKVSDEISGFVVKDVTDVDELHLACVRLKHLRTGADYLHIIRNDTNNVFSVAFRTPPPDSSGMCHILEHLALCGSKSFPCRDPFFKMLNRSVATFMNAFTGSDYTMYPFSTQNFKDFNNLMQVYLDAAFYPLLLKKDFSQEGWRLEHENIEDPNSPIILKGVVLNEMKAMHSSSPYTFHENLLNKILPSNAYKYISGGDPHEIPALTWDRLKEYHKQYYHPSNARFFSYGSYPLESHLANLDKWILSKFNRREVDSSFPMETRWNKPKEDEISCFPDPVAPNPDKQTTFAQAYLLDNVQDSYESFTLSILSTLLMDSATSPFYKSLLLPGIGADYSPGSGYNGFNKESFFSIGLTGIEDKDVAHIAKTIEGTFDEVIRDGFPEESVEAVLHSVELGMKHQTSNFGLALVMGLNAPWNHGGDPLIALQINRHINWFKDQLAKDGSYLQKKVEQYFKKNNHKLSLTMRPDVASAHRFAAKEQEVLQTKLKSLTNEDKNKIFEEGTELAKHQRDSAQNINLPTLLPAELSQKIEETSVKLSNMENIPLFSVTAPTNGVTYFRSVLSAKHLPEELKPYLSLFCNVLTKMGAGKLDFMEQDQKAMLYTGGLSASVHVSEHQNGTVEEGILLTSHCLERNTEHMLALWRDIFCNTTMSDKDRFTQLLLTDTSELIQNLSHVAHSYAMRHANSNLNRVGLLSELHSGLSHVKNQKELAAMENHDDIIEKLKKMASVLLNTSGMRCAVHMTPEFESDFQNQMSSFLNSLPNSGSLFSTPHFEEEQLLQASHCSHFVMPFPVNYVARGQKMVPYSHKDFAAIRVMSQLVSAKYLHREIREVGGAYGSGAHVNSSGSWTFYSYRDPHVENTLKAFTESANWLNEGNFSDQDVEEAKLKVISAMDKPVPPGSKGLLLFLEGVEDRLRQHYRDRVFSVTKNIIQEIAEQYLKDNKNASTTVLGPENKFTSDNQWQIISEF